MLFLDGVVRVLVDYTDYEELAVCYSQPFLCPSLSLVTSVLSALPLELARDRYLPLLATWVGGFPLGLDDGSPLVVASVQDGAAPLGLFTRRLEDFLGRRRSARPGGGGGGGDGEPAGYSGIAEGRSLCLLGLVLSESLVLREYDRGEVGCAAPPAAVVGNAYFFAFHMYFSSVYNVLRLVSRTIRSHPKTIFPPAAGPPNTGGQS